MRSLIRVPSECETSQKPDQDSNETLFFLSRLGIPY